MPIDKALHVMAGEVRLAIDPQCFFALQMARERFARHSLAAAFSRVPMSAFINSPNGWLSFIVW